MIIVMRNGLLTSTPRILSSLFILPEYLRQRRASGGSPWVRTALISAWDSFNITLRHSMCFYSTTLGSLSNRGRRMLRKALGRKRRCVAPTFSGQSCRCAETHSSLNMLTFRRRGAPQKLPLSDSRSHEYHHVSSRRGGSGYDHKCTIIHQGSGRFHKLHS